MGNAHTAMTRENNRGLVIKVQNNDIGRSMSRLRRLMQQERWVADMRKSEAFVSKGEKKRKADAEARRRHQKAMRDEEEDLSHDQMHHLSALKRGRNRKARREYDKKVQQRHAAELRGEVQQKKPELKYLGDYESLLDNFR